MSSDAPSRAHGEGPPALAHPFLFCVSLCKDTLVRACCSLVEAEDTAQELRPPCGTSGVAATSGS